MTLGQIDHMDVITHAGAVGGIVVIAEYGKLLALADGDLSDIRQQIVRNAVGILTDQAALVRMGLK